MDIRQIRSFVAVVDHKSFTLAATRVGIAQPAISMQISSLEKEYKTKLLIRGPRGVIPTDAGRTLYKHGRLILRQVEEARIDIATGYSVTGLVAVGMPTTVATPLAVPLIKRVAERYPGIRLHIVETLSGHLNELLATDRLNCAILFRSAEQKSLEFEPLAIEYLYFIGGSLEGMDNSEPDCAVQALSAVPITLPSIAHDLRTTVKHAFIAAGASLNVVADIDSPRVALSLAADHFAGTILPLSALTSAQHAEFRGVFTRRLVKPEVTRTIGLCRRTSSILSDASLAIETSIKETMADLVSSGHWNGIELVP
ncbi:LysR substrate-binding domain-containing protein [Mesorhizobium sp.]|uniref:LysR substrate-binding domain-containing protein n=1 Tax=Mesorhizobium sp. TaxID=1871066 RepID=UPI000FE9C2DA|nr:LysR substrate-binding domain-containing protein [Mesorhizobium sp.]RWG01518.1 MAG: LysR family transcriptional regulator [Mesorhizobium sp.]RWG97633.1 MAG: LysR family transcriptional regulator [Mesorhizobium sp.]TIN48693.1 MAG: LysR family transcriptional regulator [Mesorhizobium sp.]TIR92570.1 MAG: LysR family transcriptional regulator [Mesorhizobium sp.]TIS04566.1 MAG: LysR family transcriptional regulator [Mesorhizobium sp.]